MENLWWVVASYLIIWGGFALYFGQLFRRQDSLSRQLERFRSQRGAPTSGP